MNLLSNIYQTLNTMAANTNIPNFNTNMSNEN